MRVIGGTLGGRSLVAPKGQLTRPTSDRVREALFSVLGDVTGVSVLDLYAGTGALGLEALSRGAAKAVFVENARATLDALRRNIATLGVQSSTFVVSSPVLRALRSLSTHAPFDLVFVDPPYAKLVEAAEALVFLVDQGRCSDGACVVLEHASRDVAPDLEGLERGATRQYGDTSLTFYSVGTKQPSDALRGNGDFALGSCDDVSSKATDG